MIKIECKGYVRKAAAKTSKGGKPYVEFGFSTKTGKDQQGQGVYTWLNCKDFRADAKVPTDGEFMVLKGGLGVNKSEKDGVKYTNLDVFVDSLDAAPPRDGEPAKAAPASPAAPEKDPWE